MKRFLICALAAIGMVACVSEDVVQLPKSDAISFADAFIGNSTRAVTAEDPSTTKANLTAFDVWAYMSTLGGTVLEDEDLTLTDKGNWYYANTQYWTPNRNYFFAALAPMNSEYWNLDTSKAVFDGGAGLVTFTNKDGSEDLIYATASVTTPDKQTLLDEGMESVKFQFEHLLSKVKFTFHNGFKTDNARLVIENVKMTAPKSGKINLSDVDYMWTLDNEEFTLNFGNVGELSTKTNVNKLECDDERLTIPADETYTYNIEFDVTLYYGTEVAYEVTKSSAVTGVALEKGHAYNFYTNINPENLELREIVFEVESVDTWIPENGEDVEHPVVATINNVPYTSLQAAVDAATAQGGDTTIEVVSPVNELVTVTQTEGVNLVINGNGNDYNGTIRVSGCSRDTGAETLVIDGFNFKATTDESCVDMNWGTSNQTRYAHNVTISNCTFEMVGAAVHTSPAIDCYQPYNIKVKGCEVKNGHSLLQVKGGHNGVAVEDVKIVDCKNGIAFGTHDGPVSVKNAEIKALGYGVRADGSVAATLTIEDVKIEAIRPIVVRKASGSYNVVLAGTNTLTAGDYYQVIFTNGDDEAAYVAPTGAFTLTGADSFKVYPIHAGDRVSTADELTAKLADSSVSEITLESGAVIEGTFAVKRPVTIKSFEGNKATIKGRVNVSNTDAVSFENIKFDINDASKHKNTFTGAPYKYPGIVVAYAAAMSFEGCEFNTSISAGVCGINAGNHADSSDVLTVNNCKFKGDFYAIRTRTLFCITNSEFNVYTDQGTLAAVWTWGNANSGANKVTFKNNVSTSGKPCYSVQMAASNFKYDYITIDVQGNTGFLALADGVNLAHFNGTHTFAAGSETF